MNAVLLALAVAPGLGIAMYVYWRDKFDKEPLGLLIQSFLWGMLAIIPALLFELVWGLMGFDHRGSDVNTLFYAFICIALSEEFAKYLFLTRAMQYKAFDEPFDGIVYSVMISMGFATVENIAYLMESDNYINSGLLRMFTAVPAHATFGIAMGYYAGKARFEPQKQMFFMTIALFLAVLMHGIYDAFLFFDNKYNIAIGAAISLSVSIVLSFRALKLHHNISPFHPARQPVLRTDEHLEQH